MCVFHICDSVRGRLNRYCSHQTTHIQDTVCVLKTLTQVSHVIGMLAKEHHGMFNFSQYLE